MIFSQICCLLFSAKLSRYSKKHLIIFVATSFYKILMGIGFLYGAHKDLGMTFEWIYNISYVAILTIFTCTLSNLLGMKSKEFHRGKYYNILIWGFVFTFSGILYLLLRDIVTLVIIIFIVATMILVYELAESIFHVGDKFLKHKIATMQYEYEVKQSQKITRFLHDDVLQDIYAVNLLTMKITGNDEMVSVTSGILKDLQYRIRSEIEDYGVNLERSFSFKENIEALISDISMRYENCHMETEFKWDEKFTVEPPYDGILFCIIKELVSNAYKHSEGSACRVSVEKTNNVLKLKVINDGKRIQLSEEELMEKGFGLSSIRNQVISIGGNFTMDIISRGGLCVRVELEELK